jgi:ubiquinone/menaquinone biosynthesis C-methylase UbiE
MKFKDSILAHKYLDNLTGIEIGGSAHNPFNLPHCINVDYTDSMENPFKLLEYSYCGEKAPVDVVAFASELPFKNESYDYVISSHLIEHLFDPISAMNEWERVIKPGGYIFTIVPTKEAVPTEIRPITTLKELITRHENRFKFELDEYMKTLTQGHFTVFDLKLFLEMCQYLDIEVIEKLEKDDKVGNGFCVVNKKRYGKGN